MTDINRFADVNLPKNKKNEKGELHQQERNPKGSKPAIKASSKANGAMPPKKRRTGNNRYPYRRKLSPIYAALDLGTNNCRLLVARKNENGFKVIDGFSRIVRLGEGVSQSGMLDEQAIERTLEALKICAIKLERHKPKRMRLIATQACRGAKNSQEFLARVKSEIGLELEIIDQQTEAKLAVTGCGDLIEKDVMGALMFDIGGGSSELAWLDFRGGRPKENGKLASSIRSWQSLEIGVVSIAEKFDGKDVSAQKFEDMVGFVAEKLKNFKGSNKLKDMIKSHNVHLIGTSGTVTTLAGLHLGLERYDRSQVDGLMMRNDEVVDTMRVLISMSYDRRAEHQCIGSDRADLVIPGCAIFEAIRREWTTDYIRVADRGLREGMLISLMDMDKRKNPNKFRSRKPTREK